MMRRAFAVGCLVVTVLGCWTGVAAADHLTVEVSGPDTVIVGEELQITASVRRVSDREPIEGLVVEFFGDSFFAGVSGEIRLGAAETNAIGVATHDLSFSVRGVHRVRVEIHDGTEIQEDDLIIGVDSGPQLVSPEVGVEIPGLGSWLVTAVVGGVWLIMIVAAGWMVRVSLLSARDDGEGDAGPPGEPTRRRRRLNVAVTAAGVMVLLGVGLVVLLIRSPDTHHNFDPDGYGRSPVAYLDAAYVYPGPGLADAGALTGDAVADGRALFLKAGCAGCHGLDALGAASASSPAFATRQWLGTVVRTGLPGGMPAYAVSDLGDEDLDAIHAFLLEARDILAAEVPAPDEATTTTTTAPPTTTTTTAAGGADAAPPMFSDVQALLRAECSGCHGTVGGWSLGDYDSIVNSGDNGPAVIPGDPARSVLAQKLLGTQTFGSMMPPTAALAEADIQLVVDWIAAGAPP